MKRYVVYRELDGLILKTGWCPDDDVPLQAVAGSSVFVPPGDVNPKTQFIDILGPTVVNKGANISLPDTFSILADGIEEVTFSLVPNPCIVRVLGPIGTTIVNSGVTFIMTTDIAGTYNILISATDILELQFMVEATL